MAERERRRLGLAQTLDELNEAKRREAESVRDALAAARRAAAEEQAAAAAKLRAKAAAAREDAEQRKQRLKEDLDAGMRERRKSIVAEKEAVRAMRRASLGLAPTALPSSTGASSPSVRLPPLT